MDQHAPVATCKVEECSYNEMDCCFAPDIQVGDTHPSCDTFTTSGGQGYQQEAHVGGCHVSGCNFNQDDSCGAPGITVNHHADHADCETYRPRR